MQYSSGKHQYMNVPARGMRRKYRKELTNPPNPVLMQWREAVDDGRVDIEDWLYWLTSLLTRRRFSDAATAHAINVLHRLDMAQQLP